MSNKAEQGSRYVNFRFDRISGLLEIEGDKTPQTTIDFGRLPQSRLGLPNIDTRPILTKDQMRDLKVYGLLSERELSLRSGIEWTRMSENPTGDTLSSERAYVFAPAEAESQDNFRTATINLLNRGIAVEHLRESVREAGLKMPEGRKMGELDETVVFQIETMQEEIDEIAQDLKAR